MTKRYGSTVAVDRVDLDVAPGQIVAVTGANGAGKTTLLRMLATVLLPDEGHATVGGFDVVRDPQAVRRVIGVALVNDRGLYWRLSGLENLCFFGRTVGFSRKTARTRAQLLVESMGISSFAGRPVSGYSAGQRQRLILARAVMASPAVLLVDEPLRGLDEQGIACVRAMLREGAARGAAILVAAPTLTGLDDLADEVVVLEQGRVAREAPELQVVER